MNDTSARNVKQRSIGSLAVIGSGPTCIFLLQHIHRNIGRLAGVVGKITIFEKEADAGYGMPYHPRMTDVFNMSNISSEEIPLLPQSLEDWLHARDEWELQEWMIPRERINATDVYGRLPLGHYLRCQYRTLVCLIRAAGIHVEERVGTEVSDIQDLPETDSVWMSLSGDRSAEFDTVAISTGHSWPAEDKPAAGYYASPWPISKLMPAEGEYHGFPVGLLGASLSAFDVATSLAHRHGEFVAWEHGLVFRAFPDIGDFRLVMHSLDGLLPQLQFAMVEPFREIYRHVGRAELMGLVDEPGFLGLSDYFEAVCRPKLRDAFLKDGMGDVAEMLGDNAFGLGELAEEMSSRHDYRDAFAGMRKELARASDTPTHWKEILDDLMYTLNFHAELLPAEDQVTLRKNVLPFVMNVMAALPLESARILIALHEAGRLDLVAGRVNVESESGSMTVIRVEDESGESEHRYRMFVDCGGQRPVDLDAYPFEGLVESLSVRKSRARFRDEANADLISEKDSGSAITTGDGSIAASFGGIDVDESYRVIGQGSAANPRIIDMAFPHVSGLRPYSYGLQACNETARIVVDAWLGEARETNGDATHSDHHALMARQP